MSDVTLEDLYKPLSEPIQRVDPIIDAFCRQSGFSRDTGSWLGVMPRRYVKKTEGNLRKFIDLGLGLCKTDSPDGLLYTMGAGASVDINQDRYSLIFRCFTDLAIDDVERGLGEALTKAAAIMADWTEMYVVSNGSHTKLSKPKTVNWESNDAQ